MFLMLTDIRSRCYADKLWNSILKIYEAKSSTVCLPECLQRGHATSRRGATAAGWDWSLMSIYRILAAEATRISSYKIG